MKLYDVLRDSFSAGESEMNDDVKLTSYGEWDSMTHMFFITKLEEAYNIELSGDEIADMQTIADIKNIIAAKGKEL
jgi:acyl carrier protein